MGENTEAPGSHVPFPAEGPFPARPGNRVSPLIDGIPAFRRIGAAVETARHSVWLTVAFIAADFRMPDGGETLFALLNRAAGRGLDVRVVFWRPDPASGVDPAGVFAGSADDRALLAALPARFRIRWDRLPGRFCHHQKSWLVDAGHPGETAFVGGINLNAASLSAPGHADGGRHDLYVELAGPSASDVHRNFVERWNGASERAAADGTWGHDGDDELAAPSRPSPPAGGVLAQVQRTMDAGRPGGGERTVLAQYLSAIAAARSSIHIEAQTVGVIDVVAALDAALDRGVRVAMLVPGVPEPVVRADRARPERAAFYARLGSLGRHDRFTLAGIAAPDPAGRRRDVYVHAKAMLVDDAWATIGSANLHAGSLLHHTEMNVSFRDPPTVRALRAALLDELLGQPTGHLDDGAAFTLFAEVAAENRRRRERGDGPWQGLVHALDPAIYGA